MSPKYIRLNVMFPGETSCRNGTEGYLCLNGAGPKGEEAAESDLRSVLKLETASSLYLFLLFGAPPLRRHTLSARLWSPAHTRHETGPQEAVSWFNCARTWAWRPSALLRGLPGQRCLH